jgi:hypothetical protein
VEHLLWKGLQTGRKRDYVVVVVVVVTMMTVMFCKCYCKHKKGDYDFVLMYIEVFVF